MVANLIMADDGLLANPGVGGWATTKHLYLQRYIDISSGVRKRFNPRPTNHSLTSADKQAPRAGSTYIDLFCGSGRAKLKTTGGLIDGSPVMAWLESVRTHSAFTHMFIADADEATLRACETRLKQLNAPVTAIHAPAQEAVKIIAKQLNPYALHFAFVDPYKLESLHFDIIQVLSTFTRMDILMHVSIMDLQRNLPFNLSGSQQSYEAFAPGWESVIDKTMTQAKIREFVIEYWRSLLAKLNLVDSQNHKKITGEQGQPLYWLVLAAKHDLARSFWETAANTEGQKSLFG